MPFAVCFLVGFVSPLFHTFFVVFWCWFFVVAIFLFCYVFCVYIVTLIHCNLNKENNPSVTKSICSPSTDSLVILYIEFFIGGLYTFKSFFI